MRELSLTIESGTKGIVIENTPNLKGPGDVFANPANFTIGSAISAALPVVFYIAAFMMVFWLFWGAFEYLLAGGNKDGLGHARKRITYAIVGFILIMVSFAIYQYLPTLFYENEQFRNFDQRQVP